MGQEQRSDFILPSLSSFFAPVIINVNMGCNKSLAQGTYSAEFLGRAIWEMCIPFSVVIDSPYITLALKWNTVILLSCVPCFLSGPVAFLKLWFGIVTLILFLTSRAKTSISEEGIELCWSPGAIHFAKMTCPLYCDSTSVKVSGKVQDTGVSLAYQLMVNAFLRAVWLEFFFYRYHMVMVIIICSGEFGFWHLFKQM